jgi:hypothetical protein
VALAIHPYERMIARAAAAPQSLREEDLLTTYIALFSLTEA